MWISPRRTDQYPWYLRPFFWNQKRKYGATLDPALLWGRVPKLFMTVALLYGALDRKSSPLAPALRSLVTVRVSQINGCFFCIDINSATLMKRGVPLAKVDALQCWQESDLFDEKERLALDYAEKITISDTHVDDVLMNRLKAHLEDDEIIELTALIAFQNMSSKFNSALAVPPQGFCRIPSSGTSSTKNAFSTINDRTDTLGKVPYRPSRAS